MEKIRTLYEMCLDDNNIRNLLDVVQTDIKLKERSIPKCVSMMRDIMKKNISRLSRPPKNREEYKEIIKYLNKMCVNEIIAFISKKYPNLQINKKIQISKEQMRRDREVFGDRQNYIQDRPYTRGRKEYDDDESFYTMKPNDIGINANDYDCGYAPAFGNHMITNIPLGQKQPTYNVQGEGSQVDLRLQQLMNERGYASNNPQKPETPDFTLDGSGEKVKMEKRLRKMQEQMGSDGMNGMNGNMNNMNGMMSYGMPNDMINLSDDPYLSFLAAGAPSQNINQVNPFIGVSMGMGNPLMSSSSTNMMADQLGFNSMNAYATGFAMDGQSQSAKTVQLTNDYEKKMAERRIMDIETCQPQTNSEYGNQMMQNNGMSQMQNNGMSQMQNNGMSQMQNNGMSQMQNNGMSQMQNNGMSQMQNIMPGINTMSTMNMMPTMNTMNPNMNATSNMNMMSTMNMSPNLVPNMNPTPTMNMMGMIPTMNTMPIMNSVPTMNTMSMMSPMM
jgi:hypothetical protein